MSATPVHAVDHTPRGASTAFMTCEELSGCSGMKMMELVELVGYSALVPVKNDTAVPVTSNAERWVFSTQWLKPLRAACQLRNDFDLDLFTVAILLGSLQRIDELEQSIRTMQQQMHSMSNDATDTVARLA